MLITSHYIDTFKLDIYVSQLYFNVTNKVVRYIAQKFHNGKSNKLNSHAEIHHSFSY